jgi:hypothetical protein
VAFLHSVSAVNRYTHCFLDALTAAKASAGVKNRDDGSRRFREPG